MDRHVLITIKVVLTAVVLLIALWILWSLAPIFATLLISLFLVLALEPVVTSFKKRTLLNKNINRSLAVALTYTLFILSILFVLTIGLPPVISQAQKLLANLGGVFSGVPGLENVDVTISDFLPQLGDISEGVVNATFSVFSNVLGVMSVLFLSLYMSLDWENLKKRFKEMFRGRNSAVAGELLEEVEQNIGLWVRGELLLMLIVGVVSFLGLMALGVDFPLALGLIAGLLEIVPVLGPVISAVLAAIVGFAASPVKGFGVIILFLVIQQLENNFLVPRIMQKVSGFSPLVILIALLVGSRFFGMIGAVVAVPSMMILVLLVRRLLRRSS